MLALLALVGMLMASFPTLWLYGSATRLLCTAALHGDSSPAAAPGVLLP